jgi:DNA polymerase
MTRVWKWIAKTLTTVINPETFGLLRNEKTPSTSGKSLTSRPVYDILNCGSRHCFLVKSNSGHLLVHNSQFGGWIGAWKNFGAGEFLSDEEIKSAILAWRAKSPNIVEMWGGQTRNRFGRGGTEYAELYGLEGAAIAAVKYSGQSFHYRQIAYQVHGDALYCRLPSGRLLTYHEPRLRPSTREYARPWELELSFMGWNSNPTKGAMGWLRMYLYGGLAFENVTQATARDPLAGALVRLERSGYPVVLHTHDEPVAEIPEGFGSVAEFEGLMVPPDDWCRGWPIVAAGGWRGRRYG